MMQKRVFVAHLHKILPSSFEVIPFTPQVLLEMKELIELHNSDKFSEDSNCDSDLQTVNWQKQLFWSSFGRIFMKHSSK